MYNEILVRTYLKYLPNIILLSVTYPTNLLGGITNNLNLGLVEKPSFQGIFEN